MSGAQFVGDEAVQAPGKDGDEGDLDEGDEMFLRALEDGVQPAVPCERPLNPLHSQATGYLRMSNGSWRVDEIYVKVEGRWIYLAWASVASGRRDEHLQATRRWQ